MKEILKGKDCRDTTIKKGDLVFADDGANGPITAIYDNGSVDIHHADAHQGPVIDSFDIMGREVTKLF